jgi:hypothetical protein
VKLCYKLQSAYSLLYVLSKLLVWTRNNSSFYLERRVIIKISGPWKQYSALLTDFWRYRHVSSTDHRIEIQITELLIHIFKIYFLYVGYSYLPIITLSWMIFKSIILWWHRGFEVLTAVVMKSSIFWDITSCSPFKANRRFGGKCRLCFLSVWCWLLAWPIFKPWRWRRHVPPKRRLTFNGLHGIIFKKMELFVWGHV